MRRKGEGRPPASREDEEEEGFLPFSFLLGCGKPKNTMKKTRKGRRSGGLQPPERMRRRREDKGEEEEG